MWCNLQLAIFVSYFSPNLFSLEDFRVNTKVIMKHCAQLPPHVLPLVIGDFNAYHSSCANEHCTNPRKRSKGEILHTFAQMANLKVVNCFQPNFIRRRTETVNDLILTPEPLFQGLTYCTTDEHLAVSDHLMVRLQFDCRAVYWVLSSQGIESR